MKYWIPVSIAVVMAAFVVAGCKETTPPATTPPENGWTYVGTWVNSAYNGHSGQPAGKVVITATSSTVYVNDYDTTSVGTQTFALAEDWTSGGAHYFKGTSSGSFFLSRVSNNDNTLETNSSSTAYPASIDPTAQYYAIYTRQATTPPENGWTYVGTWVNSAYNGHPGVTEGKLVMTATSVTLYHNDTDTTSAGTQTFAVTDDWTSGGAHYFKATYSSGFGLMRVSNNNTLEDNNSSTAYPASIDPAAQDYRIYTRQ